MNAANLITGLALLVIAVIAIDLARSVRHPAPARSRSRTPRRR